MKHLKTYENNIPEFNVGDYLKIKIEKYYRLNPYPIIEIVGSYGNEYSFKIINQNNNKIMFSTIKKHSDIIDRKATPEEIKQFIEQQQQLEIKNTANKFNL